MDKTPEAADAGNQLAYSTDNAARKLNISRRQLFKEIAAGRLEAKKVSPRKTLIPHASILAWLRALPSTVAGGVQAAA